MTARLPGRVMRSPCGLLHHVVLVDRMPFTLCETRDGKLSVAYVYYPAAKLREASTLAVTCIGCLANGA